MSFGKSMIEDLMEHPELISEVANQIKPLLRSIGSELVSLMEEINEQDRYFEASAEYTWKTYNAYQDAGFSEKEAFILLLNSKIALENVVKNIKIDNK